MSQRRVLFAAAAILMLAVTLESGCSVFGGSKGAQPSREVAAIVNGQNIYVDELNKEYASISPVQQESVTKSNALSFMVEREILYQEATRQGLQATADEVKQEYELYLLESNLTETQLKFQLADNQSSIYEFKATLKKQILINKLFEKMIPSQYVIKHEEVESLYYASNFPSMNISFEQAQKTLIDYLDAQRQRTAREAYIRSLKDKADVLIITVPD